jgi:hypothetical protein
VGNKGGVRYKIRLFVCHDTLLDFFKEDWHGIWTGWNILTRSLELWRRELFCLGALFAECKPTAQHVGARLLLPNKASCSHDLLSYSLRDANSASLLFSRGMPLKVKSRFINRVVPSRRLQNERRETSAVELVASCSAWMGT